LGLVITAKTDYTGNTMAKVTFLLNRLHRHEHAPVALLFALSFCMGITNVINGSLANGLFITTYGAEKLPLMFIITAGIMVGAGFVFRQTGRLIPFRAALIISLIQLAAGQILFRILLIEPGQYGLPAYFIWWNISWPLQNHVFLAIAGKIFDIRQGKRLSGLSSSGKNVAMIAGGTGIPIFLVIFTSIDLLVVSSFTSVVAVVLLAFLAARFNHTKAVIEQSRNAAETTRTREKNPLSFALSMILYTALIWIGYYCINVIFLDRSSLRFESSEQLIAFLGVFFAVTNILLILFNILFTDRFVQKGGVAAGLVTFPVLSLAGILTMIVISIFVESLLILHLVAASIMALFLLLRDSIYRSSLQLLFEPLPGRFRDRLRLVIESVVTPLAGGIAGAFVLLITLLFGFDTLYISIFLGGIFIAWIVVSIILSGGYRSTLVAALVRKARGRIDLALNYRANFLFARDLLISGQSTDIIHGLGLLEELEYDSMSDILPGLLEQGDIEIQVEVVRIATRMKIRPVFEKVKELLPALMRQDNPELVLAVCELTGTLGNEEDFDRIVPLIEHDLPAVVFNAVKVLLSGRIATPDQVRAALHPLMDPSDHVKRSWAVRIISLLPVRSRSVMLQKFKKEKHPDVLLLLFFEMMNIDAVAAAVILKKLCETGRASQAGIRKAPPVPGTMLPYILQLLNARSTSYDARVVAARLLGHVDDPSLITQLTGNAVAHSGEVRSILIELLAENREWLLADEGALNKLEKVVDDEIGGLEACLDVVNAAGSNRLYRELLHACYEMMRQMALRLLMVLSITRDKPALRSAAEELAEGLTVNRIILFEMIEQHLGGSLGNRLVTCLEVLPGSITAPMDDRDTVVGIPLLKRVIQKADTSNSWVLATAIKVYPVTDDDDSWNYVAAFMRNTCTTVVHETAFLRLVEWNRSRALEESASLLQDYTLRVVYKSVESGVESDKLILYDRIIRLRQTILFSRSLSSTLIDFAGSIGEYSIPAKRVLIKEGEPGDRMFIIISGSVDVYKGDTRITALGAGEVVGEFSILDDEPRSATVVSSEVTRVLYVGREQFEVLLKTRTDLIHGILSVLGYRLRFLHGRFGLVSSGIDINYRIDKGRSPGIQAMSLDLEKLLLLQKIPFFADLSIDECRMIYARREEQVVRRGDRIIRGNDRTDSMFIILSGSCAVSGKRLVVKGSGSSLGSWSMIEPVLSDVTITAQSDMHLMKLSHDSLLNVLQREPEITRKVLANLMREIRKVFIHEKR
jgi:CRP-like cAMP-binding protein/ATP/ADP translocase